MTDLERWKEIKRVAQEALDLSEEERAQFLDRACGEDAELRREVEALLAVSETQAQAIDNLQVLPGSVQPVVFAEGDEVGAYRVIRPFPESGMGAAYLAYDIRHDRQVALKITRRRGGQVLTREQKILSRLKHDNIAALYDSGVTNEGLGYFVMEYVDGEPITTYCDRKGLTPQERLKLFVTVCEAVSFAHRKDVVHRDLKPSNILVNAEGVPKLLDFGIAKLLPPATAAVTLTRPEDRSLTIAFASPEQLDGEHTRIATDIYSLGVLLCLMLTGRLPYPVKSYADLPWAIRNMEPEKPSQLVLKPLLQTENEEPTSHEGHDELQRRRLARFLHGDLDAIVLKALRKEPDRRYETVSELAADVERRLADIPVSARKGSRRYRAAKYCKRNALALIPSAIGLTVFLGLVIGLLFQHRQTGRERDQAQEIAGVLNGIFTLDNPWTSAGDQLTVRHMLDRAAGDVEQLTVEPIRKATALHTLGNLYAQLGLNDDAKNLLTQALELRREHLGAEHEDTNSTAVALGGALYFLAEYDDAQRLLEEARITLESRREVAAERIAVVLSHLGRIHFAQGKPEEAEKVERRALRLLQQAGLADSKEAAALHSHLGLTLTRLDRLPEAEAHHRRSVAIRTVLFGPDHPSMGEAHQNLALNLNSQRRYPEAENHYRKTLAIVRRSLPPEHPLLPATLDSLAATCAHQKRFTEAEQLMREALALKKEILPENHPSIPLSTINLASIIVDADPSRLPEAELLYLDGLAAFRRLSGEESREVGLTLYTYGRAIFKHGEPARARAITEKAARTLEAVNGQDHRETALTQRIHARVLMDLNDVAGAKPLLENAVRVFRHYQPPDPFELASSLTQLGRCRLLLGQVADAERDLGEAHRLLSGIQRLESPEGRELVAQLQALSRVTKSADTPNAATRLSSAEGGAS